VIIQVIVMSEFRTRDKSKKRAVILEGAIDVFIDMGYELTSMDKIAETAGVSKKTIYNHFGSKENLFQAIVYDFLDQRRRLKTITYDSNKTLEEQLLGFANAEIYLSDTPRRLGLARFLTKFFLQDIRYAAITVAKFPPQHDMLLNWLIEAEKDGKIRTNNLVLSARMFYALLTGALTFPVLFTDGIDKSVRKPLLDEIVAIFLARYGNNR